MVVGPIHRSLGLINSCFIIIIFYLLIKIHVDFIFLKIMLIFWLQGIKQRSSDICITLCELLL